MKVELAKALWLKPKLLLLDEPTNHLDFQALNWLEKTLEEYPHTVVVVSHDVSFLHSTCREILWIHEQRVESMPRDLVTQDDLAQMQRRKPPAFRFNVPDGDVPANHGLSFHKVTFTYDSMIETDIRHRASPLLNIRGEVRFSGTTRSVILGRNGSGKSTFLDLCTGKLNPTRGTVDRTPGLKVAQYSQQTEELDRHPNDSAAAYLVRECCDALVERCSLHGNHASRACKAEGRPEKSTSAAAFEKRLLEAARGVLSQFGFEGDLAINVPVHRLSGGQKACLKFAVMSLQPAHILLLDEPTNHLDAEACESLAKALADFKGGLVVVTHDETLIYRLIQCNWTDGELLICEGGSMRREQNIGAHRLNTLKEQVRKAEGKSSGTVKQQRLQKKPVVTKSIDRISACRIERRKDQAALEETCRPPGCGDSILSRNHLLAFRFTVEEYPSEKYDLIPNSPASTAEISKDCVSGEKAKCEKASPEDAVSERSSLDMAIPTLNQEEAVGALANTTMCRNEHVPDDWEEHAECGNENILNNWEEHDVSSAAPTPKVSNASDVSMLFGTSPGQSSPNGAKLFDEHEAKGSIGEALLDATSTDGGGNHSRFRKDLVNLNKAVSKWIQKEKKGEMTRDQVIETIRASKVLRHLRELHGAVFQEDEFIDKLYMQRDIVSYDKAPVPVAKALERTSSGPRRSRASRCG